jgi:glycosyltransferase involved in cell wall biosynthesis
MREPASQAEDAAPAFGHMNRHIAVIIPAYNEEQTIARVIREVNTLGDEYRAIVVNDCSQDNTMANALREGATVIDLPFNLGIGGAVQTGFKFAVDHGFDICVQVDGDGQHPPAQLPRLLESLKEGRFDVAIGSRLLGSKYRIPLMRGLGIKAFSLFVRVFCGLVIKDTTSGFRAFNQKAAEFCARDYPQDYPEPEALVLLHMKRFRIVEVPVEMNYRGHGVSSITPLRSIYYMMKVLLSMFIDLFKQI